MNEQYYDTNCDYPIPVDPPKRCELCGIELQTNESRICDSCNGELLGIDQSKLKF